MESYGAPEIKNHILDAPTLDKRMNAYESRRHEMTRRELIAGAAGIAFSGSPAERIRAAFIGVGNRGSQLLTAALPNKDLDIVALCDVYRPYLDRARAMVGGNPELYEDFRRR